MNDHTGSAPVVDWPAIAAFVVIAFGWSWAAAHFEAFALPPRIAGYRIDDALLVGAGPAVGAVAVGLWRRTRWLPDGGFFGNRTWIGIAALFVPIATASFVGLAKAPSPHLAALIFAASVTLYCLGEEIGWRGFLAQALARFRTWQIVATTALIWYAWHWTFYADLYESLPFAAGFAGMIVLGSLGLGQAVQRTGGLAIAIGWHSATKLTITPVQMAAMFGCLALLTYLGGTRAKASHG